MKREADEDMERVKKAVASTLAFVEAEMAGYFKPCSTG
jgi:hypothetical protein